ncbi:MAG TPA: Mrp/NBP35 family ATP-binding protein [Vicinamibacterales bacterium]|nr:Mrp/NBP35 family ATP-binding protein [Vicinamibacterales bacterium]
MTTEMVLDALKGVTDPDLGVDLVTLKFVNDKDITIEGDRVAIALEMATPSTSKRDAVTSRAREVVAALPGVKDVAITTSFVVKSVSAPEHGKPPLPGVKNVIAVGAGKGGVGKTTVSVNLAVALSKSGARVGVLDGDIYGPNVPIMFGLQAQLGSDENKRIRPAEKYGIQIVSMGFLTQDEAPVIWRGPMLHSAIQQFCRDVGWKDLDYLVVDMPPGTGDVALSLSQTVPAAGAIVVTTPQQVSLADSRRAVRMYQKLKIPTLGLVENMSFYECTNCHHHADIFGHGGGEEAAAQMGIPFLGRLPLYQPIRVGSDRGIPLVIAEPESAGTRAFLDLAEAVMSQLAVDAHKAVIANKGKIPLIQVK